MSLDVYLEARRMCDVHTGNVTHNLLPMAREAGLAEALWYPVENGLDSAEKLIPILESGLSLLGSDPARFRQLNPENGWGDYNGLIKFVESYLSACKDNPDAVVSVSR